MCSKCQQIIKIFFINSFISPLSRNPWTIIFGSNPTVKYSDQYYEEIKNLVKMHMFFTPSKAHKVWQILEFSVIQKAIHVL